MTRRPVVVSAVDVALLVALRSTRSVVAASARVGISRDRAVYRLGRLARAFHGAVVRARRGGRDFGGSELTELGDRLARGGLDGLEVAEPGLVPLPPSANRLSGRYRAGPPPAVDLGGGVRLRVAFAAADGEDVSLRLDPEAVLLARGRFPSSARNVVRARVERIDRAAGEVAVRVRVGPLRLRVAVTEETVRDLALRPGVRLWLYVKATALRRVGGAGRLTRGSPLR